jgi:hypothetical protein
VALIFGCDVAASEAGPGIAIGYECLDGATRSAGRFEVFEGVGAEQVLEGAGFSHAAGCDVETDVLGEETGGHADG